MALEPLEQVGEIDIASLEQLSWSLLRIRQQEAQRASGAWTQRQLVARSFDEAQVAGHRLTFAVERYLRIADENHEAFRSLISHYGVRHWAHWNLLRPVLEASFYALWALTPADGLERRRRGLRLEILDSREQKKWLESLVPAGVSRQAVAEASRKFDRTGHVYRSEATQLGLTWSRACQKLDVSAELPRLALGSNYPSGFGHFLASTWRRLSGSQHGMSYALLTSADHGPSTTIPGGQQVFLSVKDDDFLSTCKIVTALHRAALDRYLQWHNQDRLL